MNLHHVKYRSGALLRSSKELRPRLHACPIREDQHPPNECLRPDARKAVRPTNCRERKAHGKFAPRRFPSRRQTRAVEIGADELVARAEWIFRARPRVLRNLRHLYLQFCVLLFKKIETAA